MAERVFTSIPFPSAMVANVCLKSWKRNLLTLGVLQDEVQPRSDIGRSRGESSFTGEGNIHREFTPPYTLSECSGAAEAG